MLSKKKQPAPEPCFSAYLYLMYWVVVHIRSQAAQMPPEQIADLADAIHNIPEFLLENREWDDEKFRHLFLEPYDEKWAMSETDLSLVRTLERAIGEVKKRDG